MSFRPGVFGGLLLPAFFVLFVLPTAVDGAPGAIPGDGGVTDHGAASYEIPIEVPGGVNGMTPSIAFTYNSRAGIGELGVGWRISGISHIKRCGQTVAQNGKSTAVELGPRDRFCLNGVQLRLTDGNYGAHLSEYRKEFEDFSRITAYRGDGDGTVPSNGPQWFRVELPNGQIAEYGRTEHSRTEPQGSDVPYKWHINRLIDPYGNYIEYEYYEGLDRGRSYPKAIRYTGTHVSAPVYSIDFNWQRRPDYETNYRYIHESRYIEELRLTSIIVRHRGEEFKKYRASYFSEDFTENRRSLLKKIEQCAGGECLPATTFDWNNLDVWAKSVYRWSKTGIDVEDHLRLMDLDGDGREDLVYARDGRWRYRLSQSSLESAQFQGQERNTNRNTNTAQYTRIINWDGDGRDDLIFPENGVWKIWESHGNGFNKVNRIGKGDGLVDRNTERAHMWPSDINGDGLDDLVYARNMYETVMVPEGCDPAIEDFCTETVVGRVEIMTRLNTGAGFDSEHLVKTISNRVMPSISWGYSPDRKRVAERMDFSGDGREDLLLLVGPVPQDCDGAAYCDPSKSEWEWVPLQSIDQGFNRIPSLPEVNIEHMPLALDMNKDGMTDLLYKLKGSDYWRLSAANGDGFRDPIVTEITSTDLEFSRAIAIDHDGDGRSDVLVPSTTNAGKPRWFAGYSNGETILSKVNTGQYSASRGYVYVGDLNGDGMADLVQKVGDPRQWVARMHKGYAIDRLSHVVDGLGNNIAFEYSASSQDVHTQPGTLSGSESRISPRRLVRAVTRNDGNGGNFRLEFSYSGGRTNIRGRGFLGFRLVNQTDQRNGHRVVRKFAQKHPFYGIEFKRIEKSTGGKILNRHMIKLGYRRYGTGTSKRFFIRPNGYFVDKYIQPGERIGRFETTVNQYDDWGNPVRLTRERVDSTGTNPIRVEIESDYDNSRDRGWCIGKRRWSIKAVSNPLTGESYQLKDRTLWHDGHCEIVERQRQVPGDAGLTAWEKYGFDDFGNRVSVTRGGADVDSTVSRTEFDSLGYRPTARVNPKGHRSIIQWDTYKRFTTSMTDPNGLTTRVGWDPFGRRTSLERPNGTKTSWDLSECSAGCNNGLYKLRLFQSTKTASGQAIGSNRISFLDAFGRIRKIRGQLMDGQYADRLIEFDALGRVESQVLPHFQGEAAYRVRFDYDELNRRIARHRPDGNGATLTTRTEYRVDGTGLAYQVANEDEAGRRTISYFDAHGRRVRVRDPQGNEMTYHYDPRGLLTRTVDPEGNEVNLGYDALGRRVRLDDPNLGLRQFEFDVLGRLQASTDTKGQRTEFNYDELGRLVSRVEPEGTSTWTYDTAPGSGIGKLAEVQGTDGYTETFTYDQYGRPESRNFSILSGLSRYDYEYDALGRVKSLVYPETYNVNGNSRFSVAYEYDGFGQLESVANGNNPDEVFWQASVMNEFGQYTAEILGNDLSTYRQINRATGRVERIESMDAFGQMKWGVSYDHSRVGNVTQRTQLHTGRTESFGYDSLDRMTEYQSGGTVIQSMAYDALGNIQSKSDVGSYTYASSRPHAVTEVSGAVNMTMDYDANGNMTRRGTTQIEWSSFDKPTRIEKGGDVLEFKYGPMRNRYHQSIDVGGTTVGKTYAGKLLEIVSAAGVHQARHRIVAAGKVIAVHERNSDNTSRTTYMQRDMLGSIGVLTDETGSVVGNMRFDPWGQRVKGESSEPSDSEVAALRDITHRGFTDHEMLDGAGLIHMNGRIYDPQLGRMGSADPVLSEPFNLQRYNRYSYVKNNPLRLTDPFGLDPEAPEDCEVPRCSVEGSRMQGLLESRAQTRLEGNSVLNIMAGYVSQAEQREGDKEEYARIIGDRAWKGEWRVEMEGTATSTRILDKNYQFLHSHRISYFVNSVLGSRPGKGRRSAGVGGPQGGGHSGGHPPGAIGPNGYPTVYYTGKAPDDPYWRERYYYQRTQMTSGGLGYNPFGAKHFSRDLSYTLTAASLVYGGIAMGITKTLGERVAVYFGVHSVNNFAVEIYPTPAGRVMTYTGMVLGIGGVFSPQLGSALYRFELFLATAGSAGGG